MRHLMLLLVLIASAARAEDAKPFNPADHPAGVQKALRYANEECTSQEGGDVSDFRDTKCGDRETTYCGTGGCVMKILVTRPDGSVREVFDGYVLRYRIIASPVKRGVARTVRFDLHGSFCGGFGPQACVKKQIITATPFAFRQP